MKHLFLVLMLVFSTNVFSQTVKPDKLVKADRTQLEVKVLEIAENTIKYRKFSNLEGPIYSIDKSELVAIVYANGETETFAAPTVTVENSAVAPLKKSPEKQSASSAQSTTSTTPVEKQNGFLLTCQGGYSLYSDSRDNLSGLYLAGDFGYKYNRAFSTELAMTWGTFFPGDSYSTASSITELSSFQFLLKGTYRFYFSKESKKNIFLTGGGGYSGMSGKFTDYAQVGTPTYKLDGYDGFGYIVGGGVMFGRAGVVVDYSGIESTFSLLKLGLVLDL